MSIVQQGISTFDEGQNNFTLEHFSLSGVPKRREFGTTALNNATTFFSFSHDLGTIQVTKAPIAWAIGYTTDPAISYANQSTTSSQQRRPYYKSQYANDELLVTLSIFEQALVLISMFRSLTF